MKDVSIGVFVPTRAPLDTVLDRIVAAEAAGFTSAWLPQEFGFDAVTLAALAGQRTSTITIGTAVAQTHPHHPLVLAAAALTAQAACAGRFILGVGPSHRMVVEERWGYSFDRPIRHTSEYLTVLGNALTAEPVDFDGEMITAHGRVTVRDLPHTPLLLGGLGAQMLRLAGSLADGTMTWMVGHRTIETHTIPIVTSAAEQSGRRPPRIVAGLPILLTADEADGRSRAAVEFDRYLQAPSYRHMFELEGVIGPAAIALVGDERTLTTAIGRLRDSGVTDLNLQRFGDTDEQLRTTEFLRSL